MLVPFAVIRLLLLETRPVFTALAARAAARGALLVAHHVTTALALTLILARAVLCGEAIGALGVVATTVEGGARIPIAIYPLSL